VSEDSPPHACSLPTQASSASITSFGATTDPDSDPPCPVKGPYPQGNTPGALWDRRLHPPDLQATATRTVLEQAEELCTEWVAI